MIDVYEGSDGVRLGLLYSEDVFDLLVVELIVENHDIPRLFEAVYNLILDLVWFELEEDGFEIFFKLMLVWGLIVFELVWNFPDIDFGQQSERQIEGDV